MKNTITMRQQNAQPAHDLLPMMGQSGLTGAGVRVGHLDSGISPTHPLLRDRIAAYCHFDRFGNAHAAAEPSDERGHGTHTAGIVCQIAPAIFLHSAQVIEGGYVVWRILRGIDWLLDQQVNIALLPVGVRGHTPIFWSAVSALRRQQILPIAAVGNGGAGQAYSPGWYPHLLAVGSADQDGRVSKHSGSYNQGTQCLKPDLVAPGVDICSAGPQDGYVAHSGTSMASAVVAGIAALLFEAAPNHSVDEIEQALLASYQPAMSDQAHRVRLGQVNPDGALAWLRRHEAIRPAPVTPPCQIPEYRDPRLLKQLQFGDPEEHLAAVFIATRETGSAIVTRLQQIHNECPRTVHHLPRLQTTFILATRNFMRALVADPLVDAIAPPDQELWTGA